MRRLVVILGLALSTLSRAGSYTPTADDERKAAVIKKESKTANTMKEIQSVLNNKRLNDKEKEKRLLQLMKGAGFEEEKAKKHVQELLIEQSN